MLIAGGAILLAIIGGTFWWFSSNKETPIEKTPVAPLASPRAAIVSPTPAPVTRSPVIKSPTPEETVAPVQRTEPSPSLPPSARSEREEIEAMVATQIEAGTRGDVAASMALYADSVDFYDEGLKSRDDIAKDLPEYFAHWPVRRSKLIGDITIETLGTNERKVGYTLDFEASNPATREKRQNMVNVTWIVRRDGPWSSFKIVSHKQKSVRQEKASDASEPDGAIAVVKSYFTAVNNQDGTTAYRLFGTSYHTRVAFQEYLRRLKKTGTLTLTSVSRTAATSSSATVEVTFQEVESNGKLIHWNGPIRLVVENGEWHIDTLGDLHSDR